MKLPEAGEVRTIWKGFGRHTFIQTFVFADGRKGDFFVLDGARPSIVFPLTGNREVIAIRQFRFAVNAVVLEIPGGSTKPGQMPEEVLRDELIEETGYRPGRIVPFAQLLFEPASLRIQYFPFLALDCVFEKEPEPEQNELIEVVKIPYEEWIDLIRNGEVKDDKTIAITFLADLYLRNNPR